MRKAILAIVIASILITLGFIGLKNHAPEWVLEEITTTKTTTNMLGGEQHLTPITETTVEKPTLQNIITYENYNKNITYYETTWEIWANDTKNHTVTKKLWKLEQHQRPINTEQEISHNTHKLNINLNEYACCETEKTITCDSKNDGNGNCIIDSGESGIICAIIDNTLECKATDYYKKSLTNQIRQANIKESQYTITDLQNA